MSTPEALHSEPNGPTVWQRFAQCGDRPRRNIPSRDGIADYRILTMAPIQLSIEQARRIALAAQGFATPRPTGRVDRRHVRSILNRIGLLQIDSVNVLARSEELVVFSRLGPHDRSLVRKMDADGELFEYWAHEASLMPIAMEPLFRYQKDRALLGDDPSVWSGLRNLHLERPDLVENVFNLPGIGRLAYQALSQRDLVVIRSVAMFFADFDL